MTETQNPAFTARQFARVLDVSPQAVRQQLCDTPAAPSPDGSKRAAAKWALKDVPAGFLENLKAAWKTAEKRGGHWRNLAHYISDPPLVEKPRRPRAKDLPIGRAMFDGLRACLATFNDSTCRTPAELAWLWHEAFTALEGATVAGRKEKKAKRALLHWLKERPFLAGRLDNLRRDFNRKLAQWRANGRTATSLVDKRPEANAERRVELAPEDRRVLLATGLFKYGGERAGAPAWRECRENGMLSNRLCAGHVMNPARKSYVPKSVMREIGPDLKALTPWRRGPRQAKLNGAYIDTFHDEAAGDVFTSDDFTLEVYFYVPNNKGWFDLTRGQWLPLVDCRSKKILDFILIPERDYTGRHIYTLFNRAFTEIGHPREEIVLERGKWKSSKLVGGPLPWGDVNLNLFERLGIKLTFANPGNARAKIAENIGNLFQASMRDQPGWVGPNEQVIKIESVQAAKREVEARRKHPADAGFLSFEEFFRALNSKVDRYNATEQESEVMGGRKEVTMAPDEAWRLHQPRDAAGGVIGLTKLPPECRHLLMPAMKVRVGRNGISFTLSGERFTFRTGLAPLHEHEVIAYFDPHLPDFLVVVTDKKQVIIVPREPRISRFHATPEQLAAASASVADWNRNHSGRLAELKHDFMPPARANVVSPATAAEGQEIAAQRKAISAKTEARKQTAVKAQRLARDLGLTPPATDRMANALNDIFSVEPEPEERAEETAQSPPSKEYQLKSNGNWELLHQAIREKVTLVFLYAKPGEKGEWRATRPFAAQQGADGQILVKAYDLKRQENRTFLFARMLKFRLCKKNGSPLHPENVHEHE